MPCRQGLLRSVRATQDDGGDSDLCHKLWLSCRLCRNVARPAPKFPSHFFYSPFLQACVAVFFCPAGEQLDLVYAFSLNFEKDMTQRGVAVRCLAYDNACHLLQKARDNRHVAGDISRSLASDLAIVLDNFHRDNHTWCLQHLPQVDPKHPANTALLEGKNTQACEQLNSWITHRTKSSLDMPPFFSLRLSPFATGRRDTAADSWFASRKTVNRRLHALRGNHWCRLCNCSLVDRTYSYCPEVFRTIPVCLKNGMAVHKEHFCSAHLSLWYYRRGTRLYAVYYGAKPATFINISVLREPPAARRGATASLNMYSVTSWVFIMA